MKSVMNIKTYDVGNGFCVDIEKKDGYYDSWIYRKNIGIKMSMFGCEENLSEFKKLVFANLEEYEEMYDEEYNY